MHYFNSWLALAAAAFFALASIFLKQSMFRGCGVWRVNFFTNICMALLFQALWFFAQPNLISGDWSLPILGGITFMFGQLFTCLALLRGDVSVATPLLGTKVLIVAFLAVIFFHHPISYQWWWGAALSVLGIFLVTSSQSVTSSINRSALLATIAYSLAAAFFFALTDLLIQHISQKWDVATATASMAVVVGILTLIIYPLAFGNKIWEPLPPRSVKWLLLGSIFLALQSMGIGVSVGLSGDATASNILYSSRCIWGVLLAWFMARYIGSTETNLTGYTMFIRVTGAILIFAAILIVLL